MTQDIRSSIDLVEAAGRPELERAKLPYSRTALSPVISPTSFDYHYGKLYKGYVDRYNDRQGDSTFNEAGAYLHGIYFSQFGKVRGIKPHGAILNIIQRHYDNFVDFKKAFKEEAMKLQGSGWVYLSKSGQIKTIKNHAKRPDIALIVDVWEHAYVNDQHDKGKHLDAIWKIMDWSAINRRL